MEHLTKTFSALADETRLGIVEDLIRSGERAAGELVEGSGMSAPAISRHLKVLREAGLITQRIDGTKRMYSARAEGIRAISDWTVSHKAFWESSLDRLEEALLLDEDDT